MARFLIFIVSITLFTPLIGADWSSYGADPGGSQYSSLDQVTVENVQDLEVAWHYTTGDLKNKPQAIKRSAFETTPIIIGDQLIFCTPFNEVISLDPVSGKEQWRFDPKISLRQDPANQYVCRGVSYWRDDSSIEQKSCYERIFMGTNDRRVISLDKLTGTPCTEFGNNGEVTLDPGMPLRWDGEFQITSPPAIINDLVIVGSAISDNLRANAPRGIVRAYSARSGKLVWQFDPIPENDDKTWQNQSAKVTGHANVWAPIAVDEENDLVFLPTSSPSPDFYGGKRPGDNLYANSLVAIRASTGQVVWHFQTIHHDVFDYDLPAQPTLTTLLRGGVEVPAVIQATKTGLLFVFNRLTGEPLFEIRETPVPQTDIPGEVTSPTQPIPVMPGPLSPSKFTEKDLWGMLWLDKMACADKFRTYRNEGMFTPPSLQGSIEMPFTAGGVNWGGIAVDPEKGLVFVNTSNAAHIITLFPTEQAKLQRQLDHDAEIASMEGTDFGMKREVFLSPLGVPCNKPPWGELSAVDMNSGEILWQVTLGTTRDAEVFGLRSFIALNTGTPNIGGPMVTAGGLVFIGATMDYYLRAFSVVNGAEVWKARLPTGAQATPMTYMRDGKQFVVIAVGGHSDLGTEPGDSIMAFSLKHSP